MTRQRIVSLVPSSTETLVALGADVVACTRFCEQPGLAHVGGTKNPDIDAIVRLAPDLVVLDREENRIEDHDVLLRLGLEVFVSDVRSVDDAIDLVDTLCEELGVDRPSASVPAPERHVRATAFVPIWRRPWMSIGQATYGASVLRHLGIDSVTATSPEPYPSVELDDVAKLDPDLVLVPSEPYDFSEAHLGELSDACPAARVIRIDGQDLFWWGSRTPTALARLDAVIRGTEHPPTP